MTEETHRRYGMNGNDSGAAATATVKEECPRNSYGQGGRLKFFKGNARLQSSMAAISSFVSNKHY